MFGVVVAAKIRGDTRKSLWNRLVIILVHNSIVVL